MDYRATLAWALNDNDFQQLVGSFVSVIQQHGAGLEREPAVVNSALLYVSALIYEGSPYYQEENRLDEAIAVTCIEAEMMLRYLRQMREKVGGMELDSISSLARLN